MEDLFNQVCAYKNLKLAFKKARKRKTTKPYVLEYEKDLENNLLILQKKLLSKTYKPKPLQTFLIRDPKTRKISKSEFQDRIVHHAIHNIIQPIFENQFIFDSYANRMGKGTLKAIQRYDKFKLKVSKNHKKTCYVLKSDIHHYFENVHHEILINILKKRIKDEKLICLIKQILNNFSKNKGMPLGNLTSQFFANVYLNELDQFTKHKLKTKYYIRYVDDFVILNQNKEILEQYKKEIEKFLKEKLKLKLHPEKTKIINYKQGITFLGIRIFQKHKLLKKSNLRKFRIKFQILEDKYKTNKNYNKLYDTLEGWLAYSKIANTYKIRKNITRYFENNYNQISSKELNRYLKLIQNF